MPRVGRIDIRAASDEEKYKYYEEVDALYKQGKKVKVREHKDGFPTVTVDCENIHLLTDILTLEEFHRKKRQGN